MATNYLNVQRLTGNQMQQRTKEESHRIAYRSDTGKAGIITLFASEPNEFWLKDRNYHHKLTMNPNRFTHDISPRLQRIMLTNPHNIPYNEPFAEYMSKVHLLQKDSAVC